MTWSLLSLALLAAAPGAAAAGAAPRPPPAPPSTGAVASGVWRNVFVEAGYDKAAADAKVDAAFRQLYVTGDAATQRIAFNVTGNRRSSFEKKGPCTPRHAAELTKFQPTPHRSIRRQGFWAISFTSCPGQVGGFGAVLAVGGWGHNFCEKVLLLNAFVSGRGL